MFRLRIILTVFLPTLLIASLTFLLYVPRHMESELQDTLWNLNTRVSEYGNLISQNSENIAKQAKLFAFMLSSERTDILPIIQKAMEDTPEISATLICYSPEFLQGIRTGENAEINLRYLYGDLITWEVPELFAPTFYRNKKNEVTYTNGAVFAYPSRPLYLVPLLNHNGAWTEPFVSRLLQNQYTSYGVPFYHQNKLAGVVTCLVKMNDLVMPETCQPLIRNNSNECICIVNATGKVLYHSDYTEDQIWPDFSLYSQADSLGRKDLYPQIDKLITQKSGVLKFPYLGLNPKIKNNLKEAWYVYATIPGDSKWSIVSMFEIEAIQSKILWQMIWLISMISLSLLIICAVVSYLLIRTMEPIIAMTETTEKVVDGNFNARVSQRFSNRGGNMGKLVRTYNAMIDNLNMLVNREVELSKTRANIDRELSIAQDLQQTFLPGNRCRFFPEGGYSIVGDLIPAKHVAGDFFDFWLVNENTVGIVVADVSGKGIPASMVMVETITLIRQFANIQGTPGEVVTNVNNILLKRNKRNMFVCLFLGFYDIQSGKLTYCNAGLNRPLIIRENHTVDYFNYAENCVIGVDPQMKYINCEIELQQGDTLFLYTDGITDIVTANGTPLGIEGVISIITQHIDLDTEDCFNSIKRDMIEMQNNVLIDDLTMLVLKRTQDIRKCWTSRVSFPSIYGNEAAVINDILEVMKSHHWNDHDLFAVEMGLSEGIHNAIEHGNEEDASKSVHIGCSVSADLVSIAIRDEGFGFNEDLVPDPREEERLNNPTGRGILLMHGFMTHVYFNEKGNELFMKLVRKPEEPAQIETDSAAPEQE